jgi:hypothetical protein
MELVYSNRFYTGAIDSKCLIRASISDELAVADQGPFPMRVLQAIEAS